MDWTGKLEAITFELIKGYTNDSEVTLTLPFSALTALAARMKRRETELNELRGEYLGLPAYAEGPDTSRGTARASVIAAARQVVIWYADNEWERIPPSLRDTLAALEEALHYFENIAQPLPPEVFTRYEGDGA